MNSFAFSYKKKVQEEGSSTQTNDYGKGTSTSDEGVAELHVNIWKINDGRILPKIKFYFDFGLKFDQSVESIYVYIPFNIVENGKDYDLVNQLQNNNQLLCTVFNNNLKSELAQGTTFVPVKNHKDDVLFYLHQLGSTKFDCNKFFIGKDKKQKQIGTLLKINIQGDIEDQIKSNQSRDGAKIYIRFRIQPQNVTDIVRSEHISNDLFQAAFSKIDMFDFRINETRDINTDVTDKLKGDGFKMFTFDKVHLFFMAESKENIENGSSIKIDSRLLESELWSHYLPKGTHRSDYIAHHWKKRDAKNNMKINGDKIENEITYEPFSDYRIFFTAIYPKIQWIRLLVYLFVIILIGWCGSMLSFDVSNPILKEAKGWIVIFMCVFVGAFVVLTNYKIVVKIFRR